MRNIRRILLAFILCAVAIPAHANDLTLFGGFQKPGDITLDTAVQEGIDFALKPRDFGVFGIRSSRGDVVGSEHTFAYAPNFLESRAKALVINTNILIQAPLYVIRPYATAGLGAIHTFGDGPGDVGTKFAVNYGGGIKLAGRAGVRLDVRGYTVPGVHSQTLNVLEVSLGVVFTY
jgi:hypothetical protein